MFKKKGFIFLGLMIIAILLTSCGTKSSENGNNSSSDSSSNTAYSNITGDQLKEKLQKHEEFQLIDVREPDEFASGHIKEAINIPMSQFEQNYSTISKDKVVVVICATGARSSAASDYLTQHGYSKVINVSGGISNYTGGTVK